MRRVVLAPPAACADLSVSRAPLRQRHSLVDWALPKTWASPAFARARGTDVILGPGDLLFVPPYWLHYFVTLANSAQCSKAVGLAAAPLATLRCMAAAHSAETELDPRPLPSRRPGTASAAAAAATAADGAAAESEAAAADILAAWLSRRAADDALVPVAEAAAVLGELSPHWRSAPWVSGAVEPFTAVRAAREKRRRSGGGGGGGGGSTALLLLDSLRSLMDAEPPPLALAIEETPRVTRGLLTRTHAALARAARVRGMAAPFAAELRARVRLAVPAAPGGEVLLETAFSVDTEAVEAGVEAGDAAAPAGLRLSLHFMGSTRGRVQLSGGSGGGGSTGLQLHRREAVRLNLTLAKEVAVYSYVLRLAPCGESAGAGEGAGAATSGGDGAPRYMGACATGPVVREVTLFIMPSYRGLPGLARRVAESAAVLAASDGAAAALAYLGSLLAALAAAAPLACAGTLALAAGACWQCSRCCCGRGLGHSVGGREKSE